MATDPLEKIVDVLHRTIVAMVRRDGPDLTARQLSVFLTCYLDDEAQTVRGLAAQLNVSKSAITRAVHRLAEFHLVRRSIDPLDRRSALIQRTLPGAEFLNVLQGMLVEAEREAEKAPSTTWC